MRELGEVVKEYRLLVISHEYVIHSMVTTVSKLQRLFGSGGDSRP